MRSELTKKNFKKFLMFSFKACGIIEFSKIEFSDFSGTGLYVNHFPSSFNKSGKLFLVFY